MWSQFLHVISTNLVGPGSMWFWSMAQCLAVIITLAFIGRQLYHQRQGNMLSTLTSLDQRWKSSAMVQARDHVCKDYTTNEKTISQPEDLVLTFFEEIGLYLRKGVFDTLTVWEVYSYLVEHYWVILEPRIKEFRTSSKDVSWFSEFEYLNTKMAKVSKKKGCPVGKSDADIQKFIRGEVRIFETSNLQ